MALADDTAPCQAYLHSYRPADEFARVLEAAAASKAQGCWVQRYGYLSDEKLAILRAAWAAEPPTPSPAASRRRSVNI